MIDSTEQKVKDENFIAQQWLVETDVMPYVVQRWPARIERGAQAAEADIVELSPLWNLRIGEPYDLLFSICHLADGWRKVASQNSSLWVRVHDQEDRLRGNIFYGRVRDTRKASLILCHRYGISWRKIDTDALDTDARFCIQVVDGGHIVDESEPIGPFGDRYWNELAHQIDAARSKLDKAYPDRYNVFSYWND